MMGSFSTESIVGTNEGYAFLTCICHGEIDYCTCSVAHGLIREQLASPGSVGQWRVARSPVYRAFLLSAQD